MVLRFQPPGGGGVPSIQDTLEAQDRPSLSQKDVVEVSQGQVLRPAPQRLTAGLLRLRPGSGPRSHTTHRSPW